MTSTGKESPVHPASPRDSKGWDGKLRVDKRAVLANPEALSDPDNSDDEGPPAEEIAADEGELSLLEKAYLTNETVKIFWTTILWIPRYLTSIRPTMDWRLTRTELERKLISCIAAYPRYHPWIYRDSPKWRFVKDSRNLGNWLISLLRDYASARIQYIQ